jgi:hypothetical protein
VRQRLEELRQAEEVLKGRRGYHHRLESLRQRQRSWRGVLRVIEARIEVYGEESLS